MSTISRVLSIKLLKEDKGVKVQYIDRRINHEQQIAESTVQAHLRVTPHSDLLAAMKYLSVHLAYITEQEGYPARLTQATIATAHAQFPVSELQLKSGSDWDGAMLFGKRTLSSGAAVPLSSPLVKFSNANEVYDKADALEEAVQRVEGEVRLLLEGKFQRSPQTSILDEDQATEEVAP